MENNLESYLSAIEAELKDVPDARKTEFTDEVRAHLWAMFEAKRADGTDAATAWLHATTEFGEPHEVGRELRAQWAISGQLETEGEPLSLSRKLRMFALPVVVCMMAYTLLTWMDTPEHNASWHGPALTVLAFGSLIYGISSDHAWLRKREIGDRPWQFSALYKTSPIAAEQQYRLGPLIGLVMGTTMGCIGIVAMAPQFFSWPVSLSLCAVSSGASVIYGKWCIK